MKIIKEEDQQKKKKNFEEAERIEKKRLRVYERWNREIVCQSVSASYVSFDLFTRWV